jgi:hypothetical protein
MPRAITLTQPGSCAGVIPSFRADSPSSGHEDVVVQAIVVRRYRELGDFDVRADLGSRRRGGTVPPRWSRRLRRCQGRRGAKSRLGRPDRPGRSAPPAPLDVVPCVVTRGVPEPLPARARRSPPQRDQRPCDHPLFDASSGRWFEDAIPGDRGVNLARASRIARRCSVAAVDPGLCCRAPVKLAG